MAQHIGQHGAHRPARGGMGWRWLAVGFVALLSACVATSTLVGAVTTDHSTVHGNRFADAIRVDGGVYELAARPSEGAAFGPDATAGTVSFAMQPEGSAPIALAAGQTIAVEVRLPAGVRPDGLPDADSGTGYTRVWEASEGDAGWLVRSTVSATGSGSVALPRAEFGIVAEFDGVRTEEELTLFATTVLSQGLASTHPQANHVLRAVWNVRTGVYGLEVVGSSPRAVEVRFSSLPDETGELLHLQTDDVFVTSVTLPGDVVPGSLPESTMADGIATSWTSEAKGDRRVVSLTQTVTEDVSVYSPTVWAFPATVSHEAWTAGYTIEAETVLPERFVSHQPYMSHETAAHAIGGSGHRVVAGGGHSIALSEANGSGYGWGVNRYGETGSGSGAQADTGPKRLTTPGGVRFEQVSAGDGHTLALGADHKIYAWGLDAQGQTGIDQLQYSYSTPHPARMYEDVEFVQVAAGLEHSLALDASGQVWGWGSGDAGAIGAHADPYGYARPGRLAQPEGVTFTRIEAGTQTSYAIDTEGGVWVMGTNSGGGLGLGSGVRSKNVFTPLAMPNGERIVQLAANSSTSNQQTLALTETGEIIAWGMNGGGEAGTALDGSTPATFWTPTNIQLPDGVRFSGLAAGDGVSLGLSTAGEVYSWGLKTLGYSSPWQTAVPHLIPLPEVPGGYVDIAAGDAHAFAFGADETLYGWGWEQNGRLATSGSEFLDAPILIAERPAGAAPAESADEEELLAAGEPDAADGADVVEGEGPEATGPESADDGSPGGHGDDGDASARVVGQAAEAAREGASPGSRRLEPVRSGH